MHLLLIEVDAQLHTQLLQAAQGNHLSLEEECLRRLRSAERHSWYLQALLADMRAEEQQRATARDQPA